MCPVLFVFNYAFIMGMASLNICVRAFLKAVVNVVEFILYARHERSSVQFFVTCNASLRLLRTLNNEAKFSLKTYEVACIEADESTQEYT